MNIEFPQYQGKQCLMMPFVQGDPESVPKKLRNGYESIIESMVIERGKIGHLTIDESEVAANKAQRAYRAKTPRAIHTEAGRLPGKIYAWGMGGGWGCHHNVELERDTQILLANNLDDTCAVWDCEHENTSQDGDIGHFSHLYPYEDAHFMKAGEVKRIGILTPHESLPVSKAVKRQFIRIVGEGVHGREPYFTENPILNS